MPTIREYLGEENIAKLESMGFLPSAVTELAKTQYFKERKDKRNELTAAGLSGGLVQKVMSGEIDEKTAFEAQKIDDKRGWVGIGKGAVKGIASVANAAERVYDFLNPNYEGDKNEKGEYVYKNAIGKGLTPSIKKIERMEQSWSRAHPNEWNIKGTLGEMVGNLVSDPINFIPLTSGANLGRKMLYYAATGALSNSIYGTGIDRNKNVLQDMAVGAAGGVILGGTMELAIKGIGKLIAKAKDARIKEATSQEDLDALNSDEFLNMDLLRPLNEIKSGVKVKPKFSEKDFIDSYLKSKDSVIRQRVYEDLMSGKEKSVVEDEKFDDIKEFKREFDVLNNYDNAKSALKIYEGELRAISDNIVAAREKSLNRYNEIQKTALKITRENPNLTPKMARELLNINHKPSEEELYITRAINDGIDVENRLAGYNVFYALERDIKNPNPYITPEIYMQRLMQAGFNEESATIFSRAYGERDFGIVEDFISNKIAEKGAQDAQTRAVERYSSEAKRLQVFERGRASGDIEAEVKPVRAGTDHGYGLSRREGGTEQDSIYQRGGTDTSQDGALRHVRQDPLRTSQSRGISNEVEPVERLQPSWSDGNADARLERNEMVSRQDGSNFKDASSRTDGVLVDSSPAKTDYNVKFELSPNVRDLSKLTTDEISADLAYLASKHPEIFTKPSDAFRLIRDIKKEPTHFYNNNRLDYALIVRRLDNNKIGKLAVDKQSGEVKHATKVRDSDLKRLKKISDSKEKENTGIIQAFIPQGSKSASEPGLPIETNEIIAQNIPKSNELVAEGKFATDQRDITRNFDLRDKEPVSLTKAQRKEINAKVEGILKKDVSEVTPEDREILRLYTGKGGIEKGTKNSLTEHYTPYPIIKRMFEAIEESGLKINNALEPAVGAGNFVGMRPDLKWTTIDIDKTAHEVVKRLYPQAAHYNIGFEDFKTKDFDVVISNVPFLETRGAGGLKDRGDIKALHDYFFIKAVDSVKDNGIVGFVTSRGVADKVDTKIRAELMSKSDIVGMFRLADGSFAQNAHTDVGADIIFLRKRAHGEAPSPAQLRDNEAFIKSSKTSDDLYLNDYFKEHPENILGDLEVGINKAYGTKHYSVKGSNDLSKIKLNLEGKEVKVKEKTDLNFDDIPLNSKEFEAYASKNDIEYYSLKSPDLIIDGNGIKVAKKSIEFNDVNGGAKIYEDISNTPNGKKIRLLEEIKLASDSQNLDLAKKLISQYKDRYKKHPYSDSSLSKLFKTENVLFSDLGSYFDKNFTPASIALEKTRFENMGKLDVTPDSDIRLRLKASMDSHGFIDFKKSGWLINKDDFYKAINEGYAVVNLNKVQNNVLYYSGNLRYKLDELEILREEFLNNKEVLAKLDEQEAKINELLPRSKGLDKISFNGNEDWLLENGVEIYKITKEIKHDENGKSSAWLSTPFGKIFDNFINNRALITRGKSESDVIYKRRLREAENEVKEVQMRIKSMADENHEIRAKIENIYNKLFNSYVEPNYKEAQFLVQDAINEARSGFKFRDNQIKWATKAMFEGKGVNAHDVGGGKTKAAILLARALKLKGVAKKPLFVVPSKVIPNWEREILDVYPKAKVVNLYNLPNDKRTRMLTSLGNEQADFVLISHEAFEKLAIPSENLNRYVIEFLQQNVMSADDKGRQAALNKERATKIIKVFEQTSEDKELTLDRLGIDAIFADEARAFKNIGYGSKITKDNLAAPISFNVRSDGGVVFNGARAYDFAFKTRFISERNNGKNIFLLDATPTPNKPMEIYTLLKALDPKILDEYKIKDSVAFKDRYLQTGVIFGQDGSVKTGLTALKNVYELESIKSRFIDHIDMKEFATEGITIPKENINIKWLDASDETVSVFDDISVRLQEAKNNPEKRKDIMGIYSEAVNASADARLYKTMIVDEIADASLTNNKILATVDMVVKKRVENKDAGQIIFLDNAGHAKVDEGILTQNLHQEIKTNLVKSGKFKPDEIAIISGKEVTNVKNGKEAAASGDRMMKAKQEIVEAYNEGKIKVVIGTTKSAGEGLNIQRYTTDIYHLNLPWTPAEIKQRNGRGIRSGNINQEVNIHYFFQKGTFDSKMYDVVSNKRGWNDALWGSDKQDFIKVMSDESSAMPSVEEVLIELERDPLKKEVMKKQLEQKRLDERLTSLRDDLLNIKFSKTVTERKIAELSSDIVATREKLKSDTPNITLKELSEKIIKQKDAVKRAELEEEFAAKLAKAKASYEKTIASRQKSIAESKTRLEGLAKDEADMIKAIDEVNQKISEFETANLDEDGNIRTGLEVC